MEFIPSHQHITTQHNSKILLTASIPWLLVTFLSSALTAAEIFCDYSCGSSKLMVSACANYFNMKPKV